MCCRKKNLVGCGVSLGLIRANDDCGLGSSSRARSVVVVVVVVVSIGRLSRATSLSFLPRSASCFRSSDCVNRARNTALTLTLNKFVEIYIYKRVSSMTIVTLID